MSAHQEEVSASPDAESANLLATSTSIPLSDLERVLPTVVKWMGCFIDPGQFVEVRVLNAKIADRGTHAGTFTGGELPVLCREAMKWSNRCQGVYFTLNPVSRHVSQKPRLQKAGSGRLTSDKQIPVRRWILIDVDPTRAEGFEKESATDAEKATAREIADRVRDYLSSHGWPAPIIGDSGNGYHLYYRLAEDQPVTLPLPLDDPIRRLLIHLAEKFDTPAAKVDRQVYNPSRIVKFPGTMACKGKGEGDRPYRRARILEVPPDNGRVEWSRVVELASHVPVTAAGGTLTSQPRRDRKPATRIPAARIRAYLKKVAPALSGRANENGDHGHDATIEMAVKLVCGFALTPDEAMPFAMDWNTRCVPPWEEKDLFRKLTEADKFNTPRGWLLAADADHGEMDEDLPAEPPIDNPHSLALKFLEKRNRTNTLRFWRDEFLEWTAGAYRLIPNGELRAEITSFIKRVFAEDAILTEDEEPVTSKLVGDVMLALRGEQLIPYIKDPPCWLENAIESAPQSVGEIVVATNGLFTLSAIAEGGGRFSEPTSGFFTRTALEFDVPTSPSDPTTWLRCLEEWFNGDKESIAGLQEAFGYLLSADCSAHSIFMLVGPPRSGKGTILRTLTKLVGMPNVVTTSFAGLADPFGLESLVGKRVALIPDARLSGRTDAAAVVERLLSISGEDSQRVNRKHRPEITCRLGVRFVLATNELPRLPDSAEAIASRFMILHTPKSWLGKEDRGLDSKLVAELPGILRWAAQGWVRWLNNGKRFTENESGAVQRQALADLCSPIGAFIRQCCIIDGCQEVSVQSLFWAWRSWNTCRGRAAGNEMTFGRDLRAAIPRLSTFQRRMNEKRIRHYSGIGLKPTADWGTEDPDRGPSHTVARGGTRDNLLRNELFEEELSEPYCPADEP
jgi:putative DNA primase/helicase